MTTLYKYAKMTYDNKNLRADAVEQRPNPCFTAFIDLKNFDDVSTAPNFRWAQSKRS